MLFSFLRMIIHSRSFYAGPACMTKNVIVLPPARFPPGAFLALVVTQSLSIALVVIRSHFLWITLKISYSFSVCLIPSVFALAKRILRGFAARGVVEGVWEYTRSACSHTPSTTRRASATWACAPAENQTRTYTL